MRRMGTSRGHLWRGIGHRLTPKYARDGSDYPKRPKDISVQALGEARTFAPGSLTSVSVLEVD